MSDKKIAVLTLNPGVDKIIYTNDTFRIGGHNRYARSVTNQGSKGANQAIMLKNLGENPEYFSFTGGAYGVLAESFTENEGIRSTYVSTECGVRLNIKIIEPDGRGSELNECGGPVSKAELDELINKLFEQKFDVISLCGSFPQGVENDVYNSLITRAKLTGAKVFLDAAGEGLRLGCKASPYLIKPNRDELSVFTSEAVEMWESAYTVCGKVYEKYGCRVLCTLDKDGSVYVGDEGAYRVTVAPQKLAGFSGAGDSYIAAFIYARICCEMEIEAALRYAAAASCAKIMLEGTTIPSKEQLEDAVRFIEVERIARTVSQDNTR